jgi:hypothetical protein
MHGSSTTFLVLSFPAVHRLFQCGYQQFSSILVHFHLPSRAHLPASHTSMMMTSYYYPLVRDHPATNSKSLEQS